MFSVFTKLAISGEAAEAALPAAGLSRTLCLLPCSRTGLPRLLSLLLACHGLCACCPAGNLLPFVQYVVSLAIVQAVQQLTYQQLQVQPAPSCWAWLM